MDNTLLVITLHLHFTRSMCLSVQSQYTSSHQVNFEVDIDKMLREVKFLLYLTEHSIMSKIWKQEQYSGCCFGCWCQHCSGTKGGISGRSPLCSSTFFHQVLCSLSSLNLSLDKRVMQSAKSGKTLTQQQGQQKGISTNCHHDQTTRWKRLSWTVAQHQLLLAVV